MMVSGVCATTARFPRSRYTGKERDAESGNDYFGARYYGSSMGRWLSPDPSVLDFADPTNPQSLNLYGYVLNNPLVNADPNGLDCIYTSNLTSTSISVETVRGDCRSDTDNGVFVDGTVNTDSYKANVGNDGDVHLSFGVSSDDAGSGSDSSQSNGGFTLQGAGAGLIDVGKAVDPDTEISPWAMSFIQQTNQDNQHKIGCIAQAYGFGVPGTAAYQLGQPVAGTKRFVTEGSSLGSSPLSETLGKLPFKGRFPAPVGGPGTGTAFRWRTSPSLGKNVARWAPFVGIAMDAYAAYQLAKCY
jgi:RHS repeat-associated protein